MKRVLPDFLVVGSRGLGPFKKYALVLLVLLHYWFLSTRHMFSFLPISSLRGAAQSLYLLFVFLWNWKPNCLEFFLWMCVGFLWALLVNSAQNMLSAPSSQLNAGRTRHPMILSTTDLPAVKTYDIFDFVSSCCL